MATTTDLTIPYPDEYADPFWVAYVAQMDALELWFKSVWEEASLIAEGGGIFTLVTNTLTWTEALYVISGRTKQTITVPAGSTTINDGEIASLTGVTRPITTATISTFSRSTSGPKWDEALLPLFHRRGNNVYVLRNQIGIERLTLETP